MVLRVCWNGCSVGMLMTSEGSVFQALMTYDVTCIDACVDLYVLVWIAVSCTGAWGYDVWSIYVKLHTLNHTQNTTTHHFDKSE